MNFKFSVNHDKRMLLAMAPVAALVAAALSGNVHAMDLDPIGGPGGAGFVERCADGQLLAGFEIRAGDDVDSVRPLCVTATGPRVVGSAAASNWHGGSGGSITSVFCPSSEPIVTGLMIGAEGPETRVVNNILLYCGRAAPNQVPAAQPSTSASAYFNGPDFGGGSHGFFSREYDGIVQQCPAGEFAVGVLGRSGNLLDAIGLVCGRLPVSLDTPGAVKSIGRVNSGKAPAPGPKRTLCEAAADARARNSPAAPNLEAQCRAYSVAHAKAGAQTLPGAQTGAAAAPPSVSENVVPSPKQASRDAAIQALAEIIAGAGQAQRSDAAAMPPRVRRDAVPERRSRNVGGTRSEPSGQAVAQTRDTTDRAASVQALLQPENAIRIQVRYPTAYGYKDAAGVFDSSPNSCSAFHVSVLPPANTRPRNLVRIDTQPHMRSSKGNYVCDYLIHDQPVGVPVTVRVAMSDQRSAGSAVWLDGSQAQPSQGQRRDIVDGTRQVLLTAAKPHESLSFEMKYIGGMTP